MKVIAKNGKIYLQANFQKLTESEHNFMRDLSYKGIWWGEFDEDGDAPLVEFETETPVSLRNRYEIIERMAIGVATITDNVKAIFQNQKEIALKWRQDEAEKYFRRKKLKRAVSHSFGVREKGCYDCIHLRLEHGTYICKYTDKPCSKKSDEAELEFYAQRESMVLRAENWFWARPFPVPGCAVILEGRQAEIELQELEEKEKEGSK